MTTTTLVDETTDTVDERTQWRTEASTMIAIRVARDDDLHGM
jgi:hypothetical protein